MYGQGPTPQVEPAPQPSGKARSPVFTKAPNTGVPQKSSNLANIAPSLQIPLSVNNSQGSLADLAAQVSHLLFTADRPKINRPAQITCLFWFESSATLERADSPTSHMYPVHSLAPDAIPTTGFRKWVTTILSTTQVAQNVIILALLFVYRLKKLNPGVKGKPGSEYRLLTVALMLGNKFLDDNTYTNKTWAEVSGISVFEVHIMEVEFLSNMKYNLHTSAEEWEQWQTQLGRFSQYFDQASRTPVSALGFTLPSPPISNQASPPYSSGLAHSGYQSAFAHGLTPNISPLAQIPALRAQSRKRSLDSAAEPPSKRTATNSNLHGRSLPNGTSSVAPYNQYLPRVQLPSLATSQPHNTISASSTPTSSVQHHQQQQFLPQLPPINFAQRSVGHTPAPGTSWTSVSAVTAPNLHYSSSIQAASLPQTMPSSRHQSPFPGSAGVSPTNGPSPTGQQLSPSFYLEQRNSPYRPIRSVSTLLVPPPARTRYQPQNVDRDQMRYQPLGRPQERQTGQLPYIAQNQWFDGQQNSASAYQWPSFLLNHQQQQHHTQLPLPTPSSGRI